MAAWSGHARVCSSCPCVLHTGVLRTRTQNGSRDGLPPWFRRLLDPEPIARIFDGVFGDLRFSLLASSQCGTKSARLLLDVPLELGGAGGYNGPSAVDGLLRCLHRLTAARAAPTAGLSDFDLRAPSRRARCRLEASLRATLRRAPRACRPCDCPQRRVGRRPDRQLQPPNALRVARDRPRPQPGRNYTEDTSIDAHAALACSASAGRRREW